MADKILHKRNLISNINPTTASLDVGELAINVADAKIFVKQSGSSGEFVRSILTLDTPNTGSINLLGSITASQLFGTASYALTSSYAPPAFIDNLVTVGLVGSDTNYNSIKTAVDSITDASVANTYTVRVYPGVYIEDTITLKPYIAIKGDSSISTIVSASNPNNGIFVMADQSMVIDMQIQGSTGTNASAVMYSSPTTPQTNAIAYVENVRFGTNYTNAKVMGSGSSGNCILQCSNVKYGGFTSGSKSFDVGFYATSGSDGGIGRMQLRNVTSTNGGIAGTDNDQIFALADAPGCTFIVNGCLLTRSTGVARGTGFKVYNGGQLRLTAVNFQRWIRGIWAPQTGSAPSIDAIALNFENCTTDVDIQHTGSLGKVSGTDNFLKTIIAKDAPLYEVNQDPRSITVAKKGGDFTSISASVAYITDSAEDNRYVIEVGPGQFTEKQIDMRGKPYVAIRGSDIQTTVIIPSGSGTFDQLIIGPTNEVSFLTLQGNNVAGYSALSIPDVGVVVGTDFAMAHKISIYDYDYGIKVCADTANSTFYGEYLDINGMFSYGVYVSSSNNFSSLANIENYYLFPSNSSGIGNYVVGPSSSLSMYTGLFVGDGTTGSTAIKIEQGAELEAAGLDMQDWDYGVRVPVASPAPEFRIVGSMIHNSTTYDFDVLNTSTRGRFQGIASHEQVNNVSPDFYWNFLDDTDGENDITRKLSVTFADGTHTDATTLIFKGSPMGVMEGGNITTGSGFNITVASGFGYVRDAVDAAVYKRIDWIDGTLTLTANSNNYIYLTSAEVLTAAGSLPNNETNIILGRVVTNNTGIELIDQTPYNGEHMSNKLSTFNREALGPVYAAGSTVTEDITPFTLDVTAGTYFFSENKFTPVGTSSINLTQYYPSASTWARYTSSIVPSNLYASASALVPMSSSAYTKHTLYGVGDGVDEKYFLVINSNEYSSLVATENANLPSIPSYFNDGVVALAAIYVQSGSANITQIQDIRPVIGFRAAGVNASSVHGNLLGLSADDHTQYLLVNGARAMSGDLSLGGSNITNVGTMFGTSSWANNAVNAITASAATSITFIPTSASFATTASFAPTILPSGVVSSSTQINTGSFTGSFIGTHSGSTFGTASWAQNAISSSFATSASFAPTILPSGVVSSSAQINTGSFSGSFIGALIGTSSWANNAISSSFATTASTATSITFIPATSSFATSASFAPTILPVGTVSSSTQVSYTQLQNIPVGIVSSSTQINTGSFSGSFTGVLIGTSSFANNSISSSFATTASAATSITFTPATASFAVTASHVIGTIQSASFATTASAATSITFVPSTSSFATSASFAPTILPVGVVSSSSQISYTGLSNIPANIVSSSAQVTAFLPVGTVSSSTQINTGSFTGSFIGTHSGSTFGTASFATSASFAPTILPSGVVSSSGQVSYTGLSNIPSGIVSSSTQVTSLLPAGTVSSSGQVSYTGLSNVPANIVSSSGQVSYTGLSNIPTGIVSSSGQVTSLLPAGTVSSSVQINTGSFTGSFVGIFTGSLFGTSSWANNVISSSFATTSSAATSITFTPATASFAATASYAANAGIGLSGGTTNYIPLWTSETEQSSSNIFQSASNIGIGTINPLYPLHVTPSSSFGIRSHFGTNPTTNGVTIWDGNYYAGSPSLTIVTAPQVDDMSLSVVKQKIRTGINDNYSNFVNRTNLQFTANDYGDTIGIMNSLYGSSSYTASGRFYGVFNQVNAEQGQYSNVIGLVNSSFIHGTSRATNAYGFYNELLVGLYGTAGGTVDTGYANYNTVNIGNSSKITTAYSSYNTSYAEAGVTTFTNYAAVVAENPATASNNTLLLMGTGNIPGGNYAIHSVSPYSSYLSGSLGIGVTSPAERLQVQGNISASAYSSSISNNVGFFGTSSWARNSTSASFAPITLPSGLVSSSTQINTGSFTGSFTGTLFGTSSWANNAISSSFATTASAATSITFIPTSASFATTASYAANAGIGLSGGTTNYIPLWTSATAQSSSNIFQSTGNIGIGTKTPVAILDVNGDTNISGSLRRIRADFSNATISARTSFQSNVTDGQTNIFAAPNGTSNVAAWSALNSSDLDNASLAQVVITGTDASIRSVRIGTGQFLPLVFHTSGSEKVRIDTNGRVGIGTITPNASLQVQGNVSASSYTSSISNGVGFVGTSSFAVSASYAPGGTATFPYVGAAVITGSLIVTGSTGINVTGPVTITGALQAQTKSFKIDHQVLVGKKLIYGVLEGPEHGVYVRGRLTRNTIIHLPEEWKWLVDPISITVQLTPIGTQQVLYVQNIENNTIIINSNTPIDCFYFVQATRKDVAPLTTVE